MADLGPHLGGGVVDWELVLPAPPTTSDNAFTMGAVVDPGGSALLPLIDPRRPLKVDGAPLNCRFTLGL